jgi:hypothetical protein
MLEKHGNMKILPNTQRLGKLTFDSNQVKKSKTNPNVLIAKASDGKDYGVVRKDDGSYDYAGSNRNATFGDRMATASANPDIANRILDTAGLLMSEPQRMMTRKLTNNKYNTPGEVVANSKLPDGRLKSTLGFAADVVADPTNLVGAGIGAKALKSLPKNLLNYSNNANVGIGTIINQTKNQLSKALKGTNSVLNEITGELLQGKSNKESIKKGNEWLKNWVEHPATQQKIDDSIKKNMDFAKEFYIDSSGEEDLLNLIKNQSKNFKPDSKEFPLIKQLDDNLQQYLSKNSRKSIHQGNWGVSYKHGLTPEYRMGAEQGKFKPFDRYGSWISRTPTLPQHKRISTTIHEGTHDWISELAFRKSGMKNLALKNMNPEIKKDFLEWDNLQNLRVDPAEKMGKERAYQAYLADPTEQHARIMELRYDLGHTPSTKVDEETSKSIIEYINKGNSKVDPKFLNVIDNDPKKLAELFNKFYVAPPVAIAAGAAASTMSNKDKNNKFKYGGKLLPLLNKF